MIGFSVKKWCSILNFFLAHFVDLLLFFFFSNRVRGMNSTLTGTAWNERLVVVLDSSHLTLRMAQILLRWHEGRELLERRLDIIVLDNFAQLAKKVRIGLKAVGTLPLGLVTVVNRNLILLGARL